ncbi:MAG: polysaccharide lyase family 1 protein, partial [Clostridium sp.]
MKNKKNISKSRCMSKKLKQQVIAAALVSSVIFSYGTPVTVYAEVNDTKSISYEADAEDSVMILDSYGSFENASVRWKKVKNASGYNVYYKKSGQSDSEYKQVDNMLIREYPSYFRVDVPGIVQGNYDIKIVPIFNGNENKSKSALAYSINVKANSREGFAFSKESVMGTGSGGYNDDGSVPSDASILYITADNVNTVKSDVITNSKGKKTSCTGLADILAKRQKGYDKSHLIIRLIGEIKASDITGLNNNGYLQLKGCYNVTLEGIGEDALINGWGILIRGARNVEVRNLGIMLFPDDAISLDTDNENIWIHNNDIFYGTAGSDADQAKGDGSCDVKGKSNYVTVSYNHFVDSGKCSLCGMNDTEEFFVTYHHNWFDHSDSRHPRIRVGSIHIYNNYFDGNSKYGVGVTKGSSAFVESNVFRNCKHPMLTSLQGSDIAENSKGTFSGEPGGMIKAYNNKITGGNGVVYAQNNSSQFDAYLASSRNEIVPDYYKTVSGGNTYNNFDTTSKMYQYTPD